MAALNYLLNVSLFKVYFIKKKFSIPIQLFVVDVEKASFYGDPFLRISLKVKVLFISLPLSILDFLKIGPSLQYFRMLWRNTYVTLLNKNSHLVKQSFFTLFLFETSTIFACVFLVEGHIEARQCTIDVVRFFVVHHFVISEL